MVTDAKYTVVKGEVIQGYQIASGQAVNSPFKKGTIELQKPFFEQAGIDFSNLYLATINIALECKSINFYQWDLTLEQIKWDEHFPAEDFNLMKCLLEVGDTKVNAWIYQPSPLTKVAHFQPENVVEVIAPFLAQLQHGSSVSLSLDINSICVTAN